MKWLSPLKIKEVFKKYTQRHPETDSQAGTNASFSNPYCQKSNEDEKTWTFSGVDTEGDNIEFIICETQLEKSPRGITLGGSAKLSDLILKDNSLTHRHARFSYKDNNLYVEDLNSFNGTEVDGVLLKPFEPRILSSDNTLTLGEIKFTLTQKN